jgi:hypothetical protein
VLDRLLEDSSLVARLGEHGRSYFARHYAWPVIERKYLNMLEELKSEPPTREMEPMPGWLACHRADVPPAIDVVAELPSGPVISDVEDARARERSATACEARV